MGIGAGANQNITAGELVREQNSSPDRLIILNKGTISIRISNKDVQPEIGNAKYIASISGPAVIFSQSLFMHGPTSYFAIAESNCVISVYPTNQDNTRKLIAGKPNISILMLRTLMREVASFRIKYNEARKLFLTSTNFMQALSLAFTKILPNQFNPKSLSGDFQDPVLENARKYIRKNLESGNSVNDTIDLPFLSANHSEDLGIDFPVKTAVSDEVLEFPKRFTALDPNILAAIGKKDPALLILAGKNLGICLNSYIEDINALYTKIGENMVMIYSGPHSWIERVALQCELYQQNEDYNKNLVAVSNYTTSEAKRIENEYKNLWAINNTPDTNVAMGKIELFRNSAQKENVANAQDESQATGSILGSMTEEERAMDDLKKSLLKILKWAEIDMATQKQFTEELEKLKAFKNPLDSDQDIRKVRRGLIILFWNIYEKAFIKYMKNKDDLPRYIELFFLIGFMDETLLEKEQLVFLYTNIRHEESKYPIHNMIDWLTMIYEDKISTSVNELGVTFFENLRHENRDAKWKRETDLPASLNTPEARLKFEIHNMLTSTAKLTSGSIMTHFPVLTKYHINVNLEKGFVSKKRMEEEIDHLLSIDFGAFHREVLFSDEEAGVNREFIQIQIIPNILIVPSCGNIFQFWQDREGNNRTSQGRIVAPMIATEPLFDMVLHAAGSYKWELTKTILGVDWNNVSTSSITADYTDYVQFYKKNRDLSIEQKEKLNSEFKRFRDDRSRFVNDYEIWVKNESEGTQKLNKVLRKIMAKHIPFTKAIRENLMKLPNFAEIITKASNIKNRKANELEPRFKKYRQANAGILPKQLEDTIKFYKMDF